jgi:hypothetical protein
MQQVFIKIINVKQVEYKRLLWLNGSFKPQFNTVG